jgi:hypothetical protein
LNRAGTAFVSAGPERVSLAPLIPGLWMRYATCEKHPRAFVPLAQSYGFLRSKEETAADWMKLCFKLELIGALWTERAPPEGDMPPPGIGLGASIAGAAMVARQLRQEAVLNGDVALDAGDAHFRPEPRTLAGFLVTQASTDLLERPTFRRCDWCIGWFALGRADMRFCTSQHRHAAHNHEKRGS